jgi:hypothetical protein
VFAGTYIARELPICDRRDEMRLPDGSELSNQQLKATGLSNLDSVTFDVPAALSGCNDEGRVIHNTVLGQHRAWSELTTESDSQVRKVRERKESRIVQGRLVQLRGGWVGERSAKGLRRL